MGFSPFLQFRTSDCTHCMRIFQRTDNTTSVMCICENVFCGLVREAFKSLAVFPFSFNKNLRVGLCLSVNRTTKLSKCEEHGNKHITSAS